MAGIATSHTCCPTPRRHREGETVNSTDSAIERNKPLTEADVRRIVREELAAFAQQIEGESRRKERSEGKNNPLVEAMEKWKP